MRVAATLLTAAALTAPAYGAIAFTRPVRGTKVPANSGYQVAWQNTGDSPSAQEIGEGTIALYVGGAEEQYFLRNLAENVSASAGSANIQIDPEVGPSGNFYLLRWISNNLTNPDPDLEALGLTYIAYSDIFEITGTKANANSTFSDWVGDATSSVGSSSASSTAASTTGSNTATRTGSEAPEATESQAGHNGAGRFAASGLLGAAALALGLAL